MEYAKTLVKAMMAGELSITKACAALSALGWEVEHIQQFNNHPTIVRIVHHDQIVLVHCD